MSRFVIPAERIPRPFNQNIVDENGRRISNVGSCVACTFTKILEVINYCKTGVYTYLSKGYMYGRNNYPGKSSEGMNEEYTLNVLLTRGSVPQELCPDYDEIPDIIRMLEQRPDIQELDLLAENYKIKSWENIGKQNFFENVKKCLEEKQMPLAVTISKWQGGAHSVVAVGYEDDNILWHDHDGTDNIKKLPHTRFRKAIYLEGNYEMKTFKDVKEDHWAKEYIDKVVKEGDMKGISEDEFNPDGYATRGQLAALICRLKYGME